MAERRASLFSNFDLGVMVLGSTLALAGSLGDGPTLLGHPLGQLLQVSAIGCASILGVRLTSWLLVDVALHRQSGRQASSLVRMLTSWCLYVVALLVIVKVGLGRDISTLLTGSAVLGAVGGFALQATLDNLFSGVAIQLEQPFAIGDVIQIGEVEGRVEAMTWRAVHVRTEGLSRVVVPNSVVGSEGVEVLQPVGIGATSTERTVEIEADPLAPPGRVIQLITEAVVGLENVASRPAPEIFQTVLREWLGSRVYEVQYFPVDYLEYEATEALIRRRCWYRLERHGLGASGRSRQQGTAGLGKPGVPAREETLRALARVPLIAALGPEGIDALVDVAQPLLYTEDECLIDMPDPSPALFVVARGRLTAQTPGLAPEELRQPNMPDDSKLEAWTPRELEEATERLTKYLGPVAQLMVRRMARRTVDVGRLYHLLAAEIPEEDRRASFLAGTPRLATHELVPGDLIGVLSVLANAPSRLDLVHAATEVTLLRLPREDLLAAVRAQPEAHTRMLPALRAWRAAHPAKRLVKLPPEEQLKALLTG